MTSHTARHWLEVESVGDIAVARFLRRRFMDEEDTRAAGAQLQFLAETGGKVVLDMSGVEAMTTALAGRVAALHRATQASGGRLVLCHVHPAILELFRLTGLDRLITIRADEQDALQAF